MKIKIIVPGDSQIYVGMIINFNSYDLTPTQLTSAGQNSKQSDIFYSGNYLVTAVRHIVNNVEYQTVIEMVKESFGTDGTAYLPAPTNPLSQGFQNAVNGVQNVRS
jgi:hypothetical protein